MNTKEEIDRYCSYFTEKLREISVIDNILFKKILFVTMLDTLARGAFPIITSNRKRFVEFIDKFADWQDKDRISLPQLSFLLESETCSLLRKEVLERLETWKQGREIRLSDDAECDELLSFASNDEVDSVKKARHSALLYIYRNRLVHEFRKPGYGIEHEGDEWPYYHSLTDSKTNSETWELVYPSQFFVHIIESSLGNLTNYLLKGGINPYDSYDFSSIWHQK